MKRLRLATAVAVLFPVFACGCSSFGQGSFMSRWHRTPEECPCEAGGVGCCDGGGPALGDMAVVGPTLPPSAVVPTNPVPVVPPLSPLPRPLTDPAQPLPATPSSRTKE